jgi:hypothetical protein
MLTLRPKSDMTGQVRIGGSDPKRLARNSGAKRTIPDLARGPMRP